MGRRREGVPRLPRRGRRERARPLPPRRSCARSRSRRATLWHVSNHYFIPRQIELAEALLAVTPFARRVFFCNSGAEANEAMLKLARKYHADLGHPERNEIVACKDSFHGRTLFTLTAGGQEKYQHGFEPLVPGVRHVPFGDVAALEAALDATDRRLHRRAHPGRVGRDPRPGWLPGGGPGAHAPEGRAALPRRGPDRHGAHRQDVGPRVDLGDARPHVGREGARRRLPHRRAARERGGGDPPHARAATAPPSAATRWALRWRSPCCGSCAAGSSSGRGTSARGSGPASSGSVVRPGGAGPRPRDAARRDPAGRRSRRRDEGRARSRPARERHRRRRAPARAAAHPHRRRGRPRGRAARGGSRRGAGEAAES